MEEGEMQAGAFQLFHFWGPVQGSLTSQVRSPTRVTPRELDTGPVLMEACTDCEVGVMSGGWLACSVQTLTTLQLMCIDSPVSLRSNPIFPHRSYSPSWLNRESHGLSQPLQGTLLLLMDTDLFSRFCCSGSMLGPDIFED